MVSLVTPDDVAPPLSPSNRGMHGGLCMVTFSCSRPPGAHLALSPPSRRPSASSCWPAAVAVAAAAVRAPVAAPAAVPDRAAPAAPPPAAPAPGEVAPCEVPPVDAAADPPVPPDTGPGSNEAESVAV